MHKYIKSALIKAIRVESARSAARKEHRPYRGAAVQELDLKQETAF